MKRRIVTFGRHFSEFMEGLTAKEREKIDYGLVLLKTQNRLSAKFVKHIRNGIYELRVEYNSNIYRVFFIFEEDYIVVLFNGFQKKGQKTPESEIAKALKIKEEYYEYKRRNGSGL
jgi:phage-related protein